MGGGGIQLTLVHLNLDQGTCYSSLVETAFFPRRNKKLSSVWFAFDHKTMSYNDVQFGFMYHDFDWRIKYLLLCLAVVAVLSTMQSLQPPQPVVTCFRKKEQFVV